MTACMSIEERLKLLVDLPILSHGFAPYRRDYVIEAELGGQSDQRGRYRFTFTHCVLADFITTVRDDTWQVSWDNRFIDYESWIAAGEPKGYVWGVNWSMAYPGPSYVPDSPRAAEWSARLGQVMHEAIIETNAFRLRLVFHSLSVERTGDEVSVYDQVTIPLA